MQTPKKRSISPDSPRKKIKDKRRVQLIEANMESIAARGLTETTISHISETAGMSRGIINFYFDSKETMMRETLQHLLDEQTAAWQEVAAKSAGNAKETLGAIIRAQFAARICSKKRLAVWAAFIAHAATHAAYRYMFENASRQLNEAIVPLVKETNPAANAEQLATQLQGLVRGFWLEVLVGDKSLDKAEMESLCVKLVQPSVANAPREKERAVAAPTIARPETPSVILKDKKPKVMAGKKSGKAGEEAPVVADLFAELKSA